MELIKEGLRLLISRSDKEEKEFEKYNSLLVLSRIRLISQCTIFLAIFWAYMDWMIVKNGADKIYCVTLIVMHIICVVFSAAFLFFYNRIIDERENKNYHILYIVLKIYVFLYILVGAISSINSQRHTGNIYTYIILLLIAAVAFTLKPAYMLFAFGVNHIIFVIGLGILCKDVDLFLVILVNSTVLSGAAFILGFIFYRHRMMEFFYRKELMENQENFKEELTQYASTDSLTGILNRRMGIKKLEELLDEAKEDFLEFVLCFLDINNLKHINDTYGHVEGDRYILTFCNMIKNKLNEEDILFRMGGDEFIIIFRNKNKSQVENFWDEFMEQLDERNIQEEFPYNIMASHGLFYYCSGMDIDLEHMIDMADNQMYKEKARFKKEYQTKDVMDAEKY